MGPVVSVLVEMPFVRKGKESRGVAWYSPITATNSMLNSKSRQLFVYAFN